MVSGLSAYAAGSKDCVSFYDETFVCLEETLNTGVNDVWCKLISLFLTCMP